MRRLAILFTVLVMPFAAARAQSFHGYTLQVTRPFRDCNLQRYSSDDFVTFGHNQIYARRWQLEAISIGASAAVSALVHHFFPIKAVRESAKASAAIGGIGTGVVPHAYSQLIARKYPVDVTHDLAEISQRMVPYALTFSDNGSFKSDLASYAIAGGLAALGACDAQY